MHKGKPKGANQQGCTKANQKSKGLICEYIFPGGKESTCNVREPGSIPGSGRSPEEENGNPLQYSCLENSMDRGAWQGYSSWGHRVGPDWATNTFTLIVWVFVCGVNEKCCLQYQETKISSRKSLKLSPLTTVSPKGTQDGDKRRLPPSPQALQPPSMACPEGTQEGKGYYWPQIVKKLSGEWFQWVQTLVSSNPYIEKC